MSEPTPAGSPITNPAHAGDHDSDPGHIKEYTAVFIALCVCTGLSFFFNQVFGQNMTSATLITIVAIIKALLVIWIFMHFKFDWRKVYGIMIPVVIMAVMTVIILSIDTALVWHEPPGK